MFALDMLSEKEISVSEVSLRLFAPLSSPSSSDSTSEIGRFRPAVGGGGLGFLTSLPLPLLTLPLGLPRGRGDCVWVFSVSESFWSTLRNDGRGPLGVVWDRVSGLRGGEGAFAVVAVDCGSDGASSSSCCCGRVSSEWT